MIRKQEVLSEKEKKDLIRDYRSFQTNKVVGILLTLFSGYLSYLLIELVYEKIRKNTYTIKDEQIIDLALVVVVFGMFAFLMLWITIFAFRWMFLTNYKKAILLKKDKIAFKKEVIRGKIVEVEGRRQGFIFKFENGQQVAVDFAYLIRGGYKIINSTILTHTDIEITRLPNSLLCYSVRYIHFSEYKEEVLQGAQKKLNVSGVITFAFIFEVGVKAKYKGIKLDRPKMFMQIGNYPVKLDITHLPVAGTSTKQIVQQYMQINL